jgi:hypothetical protein
LRRGALICTSGRRVPGMGTPSTLRRPLRAAIAIPPTKPASAAPPVSAGPFALDAASPIAWPVCCAPFAMLCAPVDTVSRTASTGFGAEPFRELLCRRAACARRAACDRFAEVDPDFLADDPDFLADDPDFLAVAADLVLAMRFSSSVSVLR